MGFLGGSGKQGGTLSFQNMFGSQSGDSTSTTGFTDPLMKQFQQSLIPQIQQGITLAQQPVYGQAQVASNLQNLNQLANSSIKQLQSNLARTGGLQGGGNAQGVSDILQNKNNQAAQFAQNVPMMNRQATMAALPSMFGAATSLMSQGPRTQSTQFDNTQSQQTSGNQQQYGAPWWKNLLSAL